MSSGEESSSCFVLYVDHQDHPAPLSLCYHATGARRLSSTVDRYPPSTLTEVDNAYCPQCLNYHDAVSASRMGYHCNKASCQKCPRCQSICGLAVVENKMLVFRCGNCSWDSRSCGLQQIVNPDDDEEGSSATTTLNRVEMARALEDLGLQLRNRRQALEDSLHSQWKQLEAAWVERTQVEKSSLSSSSSAALKSSASRTTATTITSTRRSTSQRNTIRKSSPLDDEWSVEALEMSLEEKRKNLFTTEQSMESIVGLAVHRPSLKGNDQPIITTAVHDNDDDDEKNRISTKSMQLQIINSALLPVDNDDDNNTLTDFLLPLPIPLRVRASRRCRAELKEGRPGILLKPKLNPLEGDTSMRSQHGQWWKKDSSAIHVMPRVRCVQQYERNDSNTTTSSSCCRVLLLKVTNPTLILVRLRFAASSYAGEVDWENDTRMTSFSTSTTERNSKKERTTMLHDLLVDERSQKHVNVKLETEILKNLAMSESVELLSAEDSFIELGGKSRDIPQVVQEWKPLQEKSNSSSAPSSSAIRLVACSSSTAWFELTICNLQQQQQADMNQKAKTATMSAATAAATAATVVPAVPLALQIQLGAGFWESSLIQPLSTADAAETEDWVSFDLVIVLA